MIKLNNSTEYSCPDCGSCEIQEVEMTKTWTFRAAPPAVEVEISDKLSAIVPVFSCAACGFGYTDYRTEQIQFTLYKDWLFEKTGILVNKSGERINYDT